MLDKDCVKILKLLKKTPELSLEDIQNELNTKAMSSMRFLLDEKYIESIAREPDYEKRFCLSPIGKSFLHNRFKESALKWLPIAISLLALLRPEITAAMQLLTKRLQG